VKVYTRLGDDGRTGLRDGSRVSKAAVRVSAYGEVDELNAVIGVLRAEGFSAPAAAELKHVQEVLFEVGAYLADPTGATTLSETVSDPSWLERWIDSMDAELSPLRRFVLPAGARGAALAHLARTICRRAERQVVSLAEGGAEAGPVIPLLNRLSDALFVLARWLNRQAGVPDVVWQGRV